MAKICLLKLQLLTFFITTYVLCSIEMYMNLLSIHQV